MEALRVSAPPEELEVLFLQHFRSSFVLRIKSKE